jgi:hypothetical protein
VTTCFRSISVGEFVFPYLAPFDPEKGPGYIRETIKLIEELELTLEDRAEIFQDNAIRLLKLQDKIKFYE